MIRFKYFVHFKQIWSVFNWKPTVLMSPQNLFKTSPNLPETKKPWKRRVKTRSFFSMTPTGLWKSCGWTSNTRSAGEKFQNAFLVHRGTGVSVLAGPCLSAVIEWTIQRSWVGPYLKFWLVEILKGTTGFPFIPRHCLRTVNPDFGTPQARRYSLTAFGSTPIPKIPVTTRMLLHF